MLNAAPAAFFLLLAALFGSVFYSEMTAARGCGGLGQRPCGPADTDYLWTGRPVSAFFALLCLALALKIAWNMRRGDRS